jgi:PAS domain-containing protein
LADEYELAVDEGAAQFRSLFENSTLGVAITNSAFRFLTANPVFLTMIRRYSTLLQGAKSLEYT